MKKTYQVIDGKLQEIKKRPAIAHFKTGGDSPHFKLVGMFAILEKCRRCGGNDAASNEQSFSE